MRRALKAANRAVCATRAIAQGTALRRQVRLSTSSQKREQFRLIRIAYEWRLLAGYEGVAQQARLPMKKVLPA